MASSTSLLSTLLSSMPNNGPLSSSSSSSSSAVSMLGGTKRIRVTPPSSRAMTSTEAVSTLFSSSAPADGTETFSLPSSSRSSFSDRVSSSSSAPAASVFSAQSDSRFAATSSALCSGPGVLTYVAMTSLTSPLIMQHTVTSTLIMQHTVTSSTTPRPLRSMSFFDCISDDLIDHMIEFLPRFDCHEAIPLVSRRFLQITHFSVQTPLQQYLHWILACSAPPAYFLWTKELQAQYGQLYSILEVTRNHFVVSTETRDDKSDAIFVSVLFLNHSATVSADPSIVVERRLNFSEMSANGPYILGTNRIDLSLPTTAVTYSLIDTHHPDHVLQFIDSAPFQLREVFDFFCFIDEKHSKISAVLFRQEANFFFLDFREYRDTSAPLILPKPLTSISPFRVETTVHLRNYVFFLCSSSADLSLRVICFDFNHPDAFAFSISSLKTEYHVMGTHAIIQHGRQVGISLGSIVKEYIVMMAHGDELLIYYSLGQRPLWCLSGFHNSRWTIQRHLLTRPLRSFGSKRIKITECTIESRFPFVLFHVFEMGGRTPFTAVWDRSLEPGESLTTRDSEFFGRCLGEFEDYSLLDDSCSLGETYALSNNPNEPVHHMQMHPMVSEWGIIDLHSVETLTTMFSQQAPVTDMSGRNPYQPFFAICDYRKTTIQQENLVTKPTSTEKAIAIWATNFLPPLVKDYVVLPSEVKLLMEYFKQRQIEVDAPPITRIPRLRSHPRTEPDPHPKTEPDPDLSAL